MARWSGCVAWRECADERARAAAERPVTIDAPGGRLFGVLTPAADAPAHGSAPARPCVVAFTRPRAHRNRMFVELSRRLAASGFTAFRFDYHGCGDSGGASGFLNPGQPYRDDALAVLRALREHHGQSRFVLVGSCFDARTAFSAFDGEAAAIDAIVFMAAPLMELDTLTDAQSERKDWKHLWKALGNAENWRTLGSPGRWRHMSRVVTRIAGRSLGRTAGDSPLSPSFERHLRAFAASRARALFLYGADDAETVSLHVAERTTFARLDADVRRRIEIELWPGAIHSFLDVARQREVLDRVTGWIDALDRTAAPAAHAIAQEPAWTSR